MFRAQQNAFDDVVAKATDENLTSENWEFIMDVCDKVTGEESGAKDAVASMIKRLAHRNANVQLYTLELANALSQNCGPKMHRELASRAFTDALLRLANDRNTHQQVKAKILERMAEWAGMFNDPDLGIMNDQYNKLKSQNPNLHPPSAPSKSRMTDVDRQKEEEELQMALKLSIQDKSQGAAKSPQAAASNSGPSSSSQPSAQAPVASGTTAATVSRVRALFDFQATDPDELTFRKGDIIAVLESVYKDWWKGLLRGQTGIFPLNYIEKLADPTAEELQRESQMEAEVFAEIKNVEKLLTLLSTSTSELNVRDSEEITKLYHSTLAIRPKLIELIGKYSQRKDEFTQLNERFIKSCRDYENLLDASMTQSQPSCQYGRPQQQGYGGAYGGPPGGPPPQQNPQRYYTPGPQQAHPYPQNPTSPDHGPQRRTPAPFYVVAGGQRPSEPQGPPQKQGYPQQYAPDPDTTPRINQGGRMPSNPQLPPLHTTHSPPSNQPMHTSSPPSQYPLQSGHRPSSTYANPQELATTAFESPVNQYAPSSTYSASLYSQDEAYTPSHQQQPPPSQQQYIAYVPPPQSQSQQQPSYEPPAPPQGNHVSPPLNMNSGYPAIGDSRHTLPSQGGAPSQEQYKPYQRPNSSEGHAPSAPPSTPPSAPQDFYRQNTAY
ncbi:hypothetical protein BJ878DRAFT_546696 [Calycina marina]|uniref:Class E vacuolar protein-sorting machinery protein HSE1 n=1 Tax=Calycina marina TaxID=1763456 RepID=A0A9P7YV88_9HELO|nr:hypothetical protein BJ878DRAFT_546696 [Calycina marina]